MRLAILSPRKKALTETFIQSHFDFLKAEIIHFYGGEIPTHMDGYSLENRHSSVRKLQLKISHRINRDTLNYSERLLFKALKRASPDVILIEYGNIAAACIKVLELLKIPFVVHFHGFDSSVYTVREKYKEAFLRVFERCEKVIAVSTKMKKDLRSMGAPEDKIAHICYGPYDFFSKIQPDYSSKNLVAVGRFVDKKAPHLTILAFKKALESVPDATMTMMGSGTLFRVCSDVVVSLKLEKHVLLMGDVQPDEVAKQFSRAAAFVQHSRIAENGDSEGTPLSILESQLAGLPAIATSHAGISDVVEHESTGLLCAENDVDQMAANMVRVLEDQQLAERMGIAARKRIQEHFTMEIYIQKLQHILEAASGKK